MFHTFTHSAVHFLEMFLWILMLWRLKIIIWQLTNKCCGEDNKMKSFTLSYVAGKNHTCHLCFLQNDFSLGVGMFCAYIRKEISVLGRKGKRVVVQELGAVRWHYTTENDLLCFFSIPHPTITKLVTIKHALVACFVTVVCGHDIQNVL